ncbi:MAG: YbdD/YjiX family protein [Acidobacteria bacterium]|nr:MAG: YbdD/YjiX family protein [Acidobacteriota bacterium]
MVQISIVLSALWNYIREVSGENDYDRYCARVTADGGNPLGRRDFYEQRQREKYSRLSRCC